MPENLAQANKPDLILMGANAASTVARPAGKLEYDVFVDWSQTDLDDQEFADYVDALGSDTGLGDAASCITLVVGEDKDLASRAANLRLAPVGAAKAAEELHRALGRAASAGRHLVVVLDLLLPANEIVRRLIEEFDRDPMLGMAQPRFSDAATDHIWPLPGQTPGHDVTLTRAGLTFVPVHTITPEILSLCTILRSEVVRDMDRSEPVLNSMVGEFRLLLCQARRRGYRNLILNRAVLPSSLPYDRIYPLPPDDDLGFITNSYPDVVRADSWTASLSQRKLEALLARVYADHPADRRRLLLDCRGMVSQHNGTSHCILGFLDGFQALENDWQIEILAASAAAKFFALDKRYQKFRVITQPAGTYTAAVLLNQPWALSTVNELHRHALLVAFNMLDTISWDILYVCDTSLDVLWRFIARYADALFFNSQYTSERFTTRFPVQAPMVECVTHHSLAVEEQVDRLALEERVGDYILIMGNEYDHKDVRRTLQLLVEAFPFTKIVAIGIEGEVPTKVVAMPSGQIAHTALHRMLAGARVIVVPSCYEGFGMPVVQGLAYGRTVIVRQSPLWAEIAGIMRAPGDLVAFDGIPSLIEAVGCALAQMPQKPLRQGSCLAAGQSPPRWQDCAGRIISTVEACASRADGQRWQEREEALRTVATLQV